MPPFLRSVLPNGPVGQNGKLASGDELLEVPTLWNNVSNVCMTFFKIWIPFVFLWILCTKVFACDQVNGKKLLGMYHSDVVTILKELPMNVRSVSFQSRYTLSKWGYCEKVL